MQIRTRLTLQFTVLVAGILLVSLTVLYLTSAEYRIRTLRNLLRAKASTTADLLLRVEEIDSNLLRIIDRNRSDVLPSENVTVYDPQNRIVYTNNDSIDYAPDEVLLAKIRSEGEQRMDIGNYEVIALPYNNGGRDYVVMAGAIDLAGFKNLADRRRILSMVFLAGLCGVGLAGWIYAGRALKPINRIVEDMKHISATNLDARLDEGNRTDEIAKLAHTFNEMLQRLERAFELQRSFVANVSHELKNPLTKISAQLEVSLLRNRENEDYRRTIESVLEDTKSLNRAALALLDLARVTANDASLPMAPTRIDEVLWQCREHLLVVQPTYHVHIDLELPDDEQHLIVYGNEYLLTAAFHNLMENGCKFSPDHAVKVSLVLEQDDIVIHVIDQGIGIDEKEIADIFQPFFRGSNTGTILGHGIGLSLVARIIQGHQGTIAVHSASGVGTDFTIRLPSLQKA